MPSTIFLGLRYEILTGRLRPGDLLREGQIASTYGVSKTPVREALQRLVHAELVQVMPGRGYQVYSPSLREVREMVEVREILEGETAGRAARYATAEEVSAIKDISSTTYTKRDEASILAFHDANLRLHSLIAEASRNEYLAKVVRQLLERMQLVVIGEVDFGDPEEIVREHIVVSEAIERHDEEAASELMRAQVRNGLQRFIGHSAATESPR